MAVTNISVTIYTLNLSSANIVTVNLISKYLTTKERKDMEITTEDIKKIKPGSVKRFQCRDGKHCESVKSLAYRASKLFPELKVKYRCRVDYEASTVTIEALPVKRFKKEGVKA